MQKLKSHKTVEQIAKKHQLDVSFIKKQLEMGIPIEHEHTKDKDLATDIALQHLDEIPDYYTRLKKMEASAKKDIKEHCGCEDEAVTELENGLKKLDDISYDSIDKLMRRIMKKHNMTAKQLHNAFVDKHKKIPDEWIKDLKEGTLHHWFKGSKSKDGKPGWVQADGSPCANEPGETKTPKCFSSARLKALKAKGKKGKALIRSAVSRKRQEDKGQQAKSGGAKPTMVPTFAKGKKDPNYIKAEPGIKEEMQVNEAKKDKPGKGSGKKDACYHKVKSRYDVWPSAYASGALVKCRKVGAANWGTKSEQTMHEEERYCPLCDKRETRSQCSYGEKAWDKVSVKDHEYSMVRSELSTLMRAAERIKDKVEKGEGSLEAWVQSKITKAADYLDTAADYINSGEMEESFGFTIDKTAHRKSQRKEKIRTLVSKGATEGERSAAASKLGATPELPSIKKEEKIIDKIMDEMKCWPGYKKKGTQTLFGKKYNRCVKKEDVTIEDANGNTFAEVIDLIKPDPIKSTVKVEESVRLQSETGNIIAVILSWRGKTYSLRMFFPQVNMPSKKDVTSEIQKIYPGAVVLQYNVSSLQAGMPLIQVVNSRSKNYLLNNKTIGEETSVEEDWQKVNRQDKTDGLSPAAVKAYRRENPGSKLQTAVTEKNPEGKRAKRRSSFCRRMKGMKSKLTSSETARDPDSRINKALRRWRCN